MIKLFSDSADFNSIIHASGDPMICGFTTNPTLMRQALISNYADFSINAIKFLTKTRSDTSLSLEVFADDEENIIRQAQTIADWGREYSYLVYVKIPVMYTNGDPTYNLINKLSKQGINLNVTAVFTQEQLEWVANSLDEENKHIISVFAGRIADAGYDPKLPFIGGKKYLSRNQKKNIELLWASSREAHNFVDAQESGADIITMSPELISKVKSFGKNLMNFSKETCLMFYSDAIKSGYTI